MQSIIYNLKNKMNQKKELLIEILKQLEWHWDLAPWFLVIIEKTGNEELIDDLLKLIKTGIKSIKNKRIKTKLINRIKEMKKKWDIEQEKEREEADELLEDFINGIEE